MKNLFLELHNLRSPSGYALPGCEKEYQFLRNCIIENHLLLVRKIASWYYKNSSGKSLSLDDLISAGNLGLFPAVEKFDPHNGCSFITYATRWIKDAIRQECYKKLIHIPESTLRKSRTVTKYMENEQCSFEDAVYMLELTDRQIAGVKQHMNTNYTPLSTKDNGDTDIPFKDEYNSEESVYDPEWLDKFKKLLPFVSSDRREFLLEKMSGKSYQQIAEGRGITPQIVYNRVTDAIYQMQSANK